MNKTAVVSFTTEQKEMPSGVVVAGFAVTLNLDGAMADQVVVDSLVDPVSFSITIPGSYTVSAARVSDSGENISDVVTSEAFTVSADMMDVPLTVVVSIS